MAKRLDNDLTQGKVTGMLLKFAWPILIANILQTLYSVVDTIVVGQFVGSVGLSAVTNSSNVTFLLTTIGMGFASGGQILISQLKGAGNEEGQKQAIGNLITLCVILGIGTGVIGIFCCNWALGAMKVPGEAFGQASDYMIICSAGMVFVYIYNAISAIMRGLGDSTTPMVIIAIASVINIILDIVFVGPMNMGAGGAALATIIAQGVSALVGFVYLYKHRESFVFDFKFKSYALKKKWVGELCRMGIPMALQMSAINLSMTVMTAMVNAYGIAASAAIGVGGKICNICTMPYHALNTAAVSMAGQNIGAGKPERIHKIVNICLVINMAVTAVTTAAILLFPRQLVLIFGSEEDVIELSVLYLRLHIFNNLFQGLFSAYSAACMGVGNALLGACAFMADGIVLRLSLCVIFTTVFNMGLTGLYLGSALAPIGAALIFGIYYYSGKWKTYRRNAA